ncbi:MAG TPA: DUF1800 family protein [Cyclobacteriaceae bacterium]|nr:DUF1800 family protein [Cyclobacteriaceae bacterium]
MPLPEYAGTLGVKRAAHLLRRATFGATKQQIDSFAALTPTQAINQLFRQTLPDPELPIDPETGTEWVTLGTTDANSGDSDLQEYFKQWFVGQMLSAGVSPSLSLAHSAREKVIFFLHTHFTAIQSKIDSSRALYFQNQLFRLFALDATVANADVNFKELTKKISVDNAMLRLLDGSLNVKGSPNENYGRELLELYSIGRGLEGSLPPITEEGDYIIYKEQDVQAAAKVLSGWEFDEDFATVDPDTNLPKGKVKGGINNASSHDNDPKQFSDRFGSQVIQGDAALMPGGNPTEASAYDEVDQLIELIYAQTETPKNICRKIYRFYVFGPHDAASVNAVESAAINEMANTFVSGGYKLQPVIENLLRSQHFYEAAAGIGDDNFGGIIKSPLDLVLGAVRFFNLSVPATTSVGPFYEMTGEIISIINDQGMGFYEPFDVSGYDAYSQYPVYHRSWISVNYLTRRYEFIRNLVNPADMGVLKVQVLDFFTATFSNAVIRDARTLVTEFAKYVLPVTDNLTYDTNIDDNSGLTAERLNYFLKAFLSDIYPPGTEETSWTSNWDSQTNMDTVRGQLENLVNAMLQSPEYQLA